MNWIKPLISKGGQRSSVPNKFFYAFKHIKGKDDAKVTNTKAVKIVKINRHMKTRRIPHIVLEGYTKKDNLTDDEKNKIRARVSKMTQELVEDRFMKKSKPLKRNKKETKKQSSAKYDLSPMDDLVAEFDIEEELGLDLKTYPNTYIKDSHWSQESLIYGFLQIPNVLIDKHKEIGLSDIELLFLLCLLVKGEDLITTDDDKIFPFKPPTVEKYRDSLEAKGIMKSVPIDDGFMYNFDGLQEILCGLADVEYKKEYKEKTSIQDNGELKSDIMDDVMSYVNDKIESLRERDKAMSEKIMKLEKEVRLVKRTNKNGPTKTAVTKKKLSYDVIEDELLRRKVKRYNNAMGNDLSQKDLALIQNESFERTFMQIDDRLLIEPVMNYVYHKKFKKGSLGDNGLTSVYGIKIFEWIRRESEIESDPMYAWILRGEFDKYITSKKIDVDKAAEELGYKIIRDHGVIKVNTLDGNHVENHTAKLDIYNRMYGYDQVD